MSDIQKAFDRLLTLIESDHIQYNLFLDNDDSHCCELGMWNIEPGHRDVTVSAWGDTPAEAIQGAMAKWEAGEQYQEKPAFRIAPPGTSSLTDQPKKTTFTFKPEFLARCAEIENVLLAHGVDSELAQKVAHFLAAGVIRPVAGDLDNLGVDAQIVKAADFQALFAG